MIDDLSEEARKASEMLAGRTVEVVWRHREAEVGIEFTDGTRLFVNWKSDGTLEMSINGEGFEE